MDSHDLGLVMSVVERRAPRFTLEWPSFYAVNNGPEWEGTVINLSRDGCAIRKTAHVQRGDTFKCPSSHHGTNRLSRLVWQWCAGRQPCILASNS